MTANQNCQAVCFNINSAVIIRVTGPHAERYLNARLTNDIQAQGDGTFLLAAALSPVGKTDALVSVLRLNKSEFLLICDGGEAKAILAAIAQFKVSERLEILDVSEEFALWHLSHLNTESVDIECTCLIKLSEILGPRIIVTPENNIFRVFEDTFIFRQKRISSIGWDLVLSRKLSPSILPNAGLLELSPGVFHALRIKAGKPMFPFEINPNLLFAQAGVTEAISYTKGCYVGQEVIAKLDALGKLPRQLVRLVIKGKAEVKLNQEVTSKSSENSLGKILSSAYDELSDLTWCYADLRGSKHDTEVSVANFTARVSD